MFYFINHFSKSFFCTLEFLYGFTLQNPPINTYKMENQEILKKQVQDLIASNRTEQALKLLAEKQLNSLDRELIILNGRFNKIKDDQRMGIIDNETASRELNKINIGLLDLSEKIGSNTENPNPKVLSLNGDKKSNKMLPLIIGGVVLLAIIGFFGIRSLNSSSSDPDQTTPPSIQSSASLVQVDFTMDKTTCTAPCEVQFTSNSQDADSFFWEFGDGQISNLPNPLHKYIEGETYSVTLTAISKTTNNKITKSIKVNPMPPPTVGQKPLPIANFKMNKSTCIAPCKISFSNLSKNATKYSWKVGNKKESGKKDFQRSFNTPGKYSIKLSVSNGSADNTYEQFIQIDAPTKPSPPPSGPLPVANFKMDKSTCTAPCKITFSNSSKNATNFSWKVNDKQESVTRDFQHTFKSAGKYSIKLIAGSGSKQNTYEQSIQIDAPPPTPTPPNAKNIALGRKAWQSSTSDEREAILATDGNRDGNYSNGSVTLTHKSKNPNLTMDLGKIHDIKTIKLYNRTDCCAEQLNNFTIWVTDTGNWNTATAFAKNVSYKAGSVLTFTGNSHGRYVRITLNEPGILSLAEVEVFSK